GSAALSSSSAAAFLQEFTTTGAPVQTIALPTAASGSNHALTLTGNASSEGFLQISTDGNYLHLAGYDTAPGTAAPSGVAPSTINRVVGMVTISSGTVNTTTALNDSYNGSNVRSAITTNGTDIWVDGNAGSGLSASAGTRYTTLGATTATRVNTGTNSGSN